MLEGMDINSEDIDLTRYSQEERNHILRMGLFVHERGREFWTQKNVAILSCEYEIEQMKEQVEAMKKKIHEVREEEFIKGERRADDYRRESEERRKECELERKRCDLLISSINIEVDRLTATRVEELTKIIHELRIKNEWYFNMYEDKSKGKHYEEELYPKLLDYNDKHLNSVWTILHVGSVLNEKTDFHFRHKELGITVLLDTKNNLPTNPVASTSEFERDVLRKETNAVGGVMLANGNICNKKRFEHNKIKGGKHLIFVSGFDRNNIAFVFMLLDWMIDIVQSKSVEEVQSSTMKKVLVNCYRKELSQLDALEKAKKAVQRSIDEIVYDYISHFNEDIELALKTEEVLQSSSRVKEKASTEFVSIDDLEQGRRVIGVRSKYYLQYDSPDPCIQYFKSNYARKQKMQQLSEIVETLEDA